MVPVANTTEPYDHLRQQARIAAWALTAHTPDPYDICRHCHRKWPCEPYVLATRAIADYKERLLAPRPVTGL